VCWPSGFTVEDFFTLGLGFDLAGAVLLGLGLLRSPAQIAWTGTWFGVGDLRAAAIEDRVRAEFGGLALVVGFGLQLFGALAILYGATIDTGWDAVVVGAVTGAAGVVIVIGAYRGLRRQRLRKLLVRVARAIPSGRSDAGETPEESRSDWLPHGPELRKMGERAGFPAVTEDEPLPYYLRRVFDVTDYFEPEERGGNKVEPPGQ
jgi:hypothetical protein